MIKEIKKRIEIKELDEALDLINIELASIQRPTLDTAILFKLKGDIFYKKNNILESNVFFEEALNIVKNRKDKIAVNLAGELNFLIGLNYHFQNDFKKTYTYYHESLSILNEKDHKEIIIQIKFHFGRLLRNFNLDGKSLQYFLEAKSIYKTINKPTFETEILYHHTLTNIALYFIYNKIDYALALEHLIESCQFYKKNNLYSFYLTVGEEIIEVYCKKGDIPSAENFYTSYKSYLENCKSPLVHSKFIFLLTEFCISIYKNTSAIQYKKLQKIRKYIAKNEINANYFLGYFQILLLYYKNISLSLENNKLIDKTLESEIAKFLDLTSKNFWLQTNSIFDRLYEFYNLTNFKGANQFYKCYIINLNRINTEKNELLTLDIKTKYQTELVESKLKNQIEYNVKLEEINHSLNNFAIIAAHDLKAPLRTISEFSKLLLKKYQSSMQDKDIELFDIIISNTTSLNKLINDLLAFSNIDKNLETKSWINLNLIIDKVLNKLKADINESNVKFEIQKLPDIIGHESLIIQLFLNIINNSLKFRRSEISPIIGINATDLDEDHITICIKDNGIGIADEFYNTIFEPFKKLHSSHQYEGNGIGLSFCKKIIDYYNCKIWVESKIDIGTEVYFTLKLK